MQNLMILVDNPTASKDLLYTILIELLPIAPPAVDASPKLLAIAETCREFGVSKTTLSECRKKGIVPFVRLGSRVYCERTSVLEAGHSHLKYQHKG